MTKVDNSKTRLNKGMIITVVLIGVMFFSVVWSIDGPDKLLKSILAANPLWLTLATVVFLGSWLAESLVLHILTKQLLKADQPLKESLLLGIIGKLFDYVTPMATGGQPVQVLRMSRQGISVGGATSVMLLKFITFQMITTALSLMAFVAGFNFFGRIKLGFGAMIIVGMVINVTVMFLLLSTIFAAKKIATLGEKLIGFLVKINVVKNQLAAVEKLHREVETFADSSRLIFKNKALLWQTLGLTLLQVVLFHLVAYLVFVALGAPLNLLWLAFLASLFVWIGTAFIPLPGASVGVEAAFYLFFAAVYKDGAAIGLAMMVWRIVTYYLPIVIGMIVYVKDKHGKVKEVY